MKPFSKFIKETIASTTRKSIPHLGGDTSNIVDEDVFLDLLNFIEQNYNSVITPQKINITEKFDGFGIRFGLDQDKRFFIESSRSGPVFDAGTFRNFAIKKFGSSNPIAEGYEDIFITLQQNPKLQAVLKKYWEPSGLKVIAEALYLPNKKEEIKEGDDDYVVFVATRYKKAKLGTWATFILFNATDGNNKELEENKKQSLFEDLKALSTSDIKFETPEIEEVSNIDISKEIIQVKKFISEIENQYKAKINDILSSKSRKKSDMEIKNAVKSKIIEFQKVLANKIAQHIIKGKLGDIEGVVFKLANGLMFKVVSDAFKEAKKQRNLNYGIKQQ